MTHPSDTTHPAMGIREFARYYGYSEAEVRRAMRHLSIRGTSQGRGRPTLLSPAEQGALMEHIEGPDEQVAMRSASSAASATDSVSTSAASAAPVQNLPIQDIPELETPAPEPNSSAASAPQAPGSQIPVSQAAPPQPIEAETLDTTPMAVSSTVGPNARGMLAQSELSFTRDHLNISPGNHRTTLETPPIPQSYDLAQFRSPESIQAIADPGEVANQAMAAIDALVAGMDADIHQQRQQLQQTQEAAKALRVKAKHLQDKKLEYMIQSTAMGQSQQRYTSELQEALGEIQSLGKSPRSEQEPPSS